jgi:hypothetical protein
LNRVAEIQRPGDEMDERKRLIEQEIKKIVHTEEDRELLELIPWVLGQSAKEDQSAETQGIRRVVPGGGLNRRLDNDSPPL